jgi:glycosyltransferase involved in cell wall biosynthesis
VRRRVLLLVKGLGRGGAEQLLVSGARHHDRDRFDYEAAYLLPHKDALVEDLRDEGVPVACLSGSRGIGWLGRLRSLVRDRRIDLVHAHSPYAAIGARLALGRRSPKLVYTEHNVWARYHPATRWANLATFPRNDHVFAVAEDVRASIAYPMALSFRRMPPTETLHHGIDLERFPTPAPTDGVRAELGIEEGAPVVGTVANFKAHKAHDVLLRAAVLVRRDVPDVRFVLVGTGPLEDDVRRQASARGLDDQVVFAGFREDVPRVAASFDVFALPSTYEGLSIALLEAMALERPPVVTRVGGLPEVVADGVSGLLVPSGDPDALAAQIVRLLQDPKLRADMGAAARRRVAAFDIRRAVARTEKVYGELLG